MMRYSVTVFECLKDFIFLSALVEDSVVQFSLMVSRHVEVGGIRSLFRSR
jgi:hypothetical protein